MLEPEEDSAATQDNTNSLSISDIPAEVLIAIFSYIKRLPDLYALHLVSRGWHDLTVEPYIMKPFFLNN